MRSQIISLVLGGIACLVLLTFICFATVYLINNWNEDEELIRISNPSVAKAQRSKQVQTRANANSTAITVSDAANSPRLLTPPKPANNRWMLTPPKEQHLRTYHQRNRSHSDPDLLRADRSVTLTVVSPQSPHQRSRKRRHSLSDAKSADSPSIESRSERSISPLSSSHSNSSGSDKKADVSYIVEEVPPTTMIDRVTKMNVGRASMMTMCSMPSVAPSHDTMSALSYDSYNTADTVMGCASSSKQKGKGHKLSVTRMIVGKGPRIVSDSGTSYSLVSTNLSCFEDAWFDATKTQSTQSKLMRSLLTETDSKRENTEHAGHESDSTLTITFHNDPNGDYNEMHKVCAVDALAVDEEQRTHRRCCHVMDGRPVCGLKALRENGGDSEREQKEKASPPALKQTLRRKKGKKHKMKALHKYESSVDVMASHHEVPLIRRSSVLKLQTSKLVKTRRALFQNDDDDDELP